MAQVLNVGQGHGRADEVAAVYFEKQERALCGMHALNNALGQAVFTEADMDLAVHILLDEGGAERGEVREDHIAPGGYFSSEVLAQVLQSKAMAAFDRVRWEMRLEPVTCLEHLHAATGAVQNRANAHWVAYRCIANKILRLDSLATGPVQLTEEQLMEDLHRYPSTYAIREI